MQVRATYIEKVLKDEIFHVVEYYTIYDIYEETMQIKYKPN